ncbi:hypothetical protein [Lactococcus phage PLG-II]|nr:hypothetical protein [Lactococcus phage PLG-II]
MITGMIITTTGIVIAVTTALWYLYDEYKTYQDKYEWARSQRDRARQELFELKLNLVKANKIIEKLERDKGNQTVNISVDTDAVVSKVIAKVNKDIEAIKKREEIFIKVDGKEINTEKLKEIIRKEKEENGNKF